MSNAAVFWMLWNDKAEIENWLNILYDHWWGNSETGSGSAKEKSEVPSIFSCFMKSSLSPHMPTTPSEFIIGV